jgi:hypothetical protein
MNPRTLGPVASTRPQRAIIYYYENNIFLNNSLETSDNQLAAQVHGPQFEKPVQA